VSRRPARAVGGLAHRAPPRTARLGRAATTLLAIVLLAACAAKPPAPRGGTRVTLLPQADGTPSAVVVRSADAAGAQTEQTLDLPYQTVNVSRSQPGTVQNTDAARVGTTYEPLFTAVPPPPERFVVYFRTGTTVLTAESQAALARVLAAAQKRSGAEIVLVGHTDTTSTGEANDALSIRRAMLVREQFVQRGFPPALVEATGRGERDLAVKTRDGVEEARNRRVEILVR